MSETEVAARGPSFDPLRGKQPPGGEPAVSLVIPAHNAEGTVGVCLESVVDLLVDGRLEEIILIDDGSTDDTAKLARGYPVCCLTTGGCGPAAARNAGWRAARGSIIWFIDSDCVAEPDALPLLLEHLKDPGVVAAGGSYGNMRPDSLLACLIHEEIIERHLAMSTEVDYFATFNVIVRRHALDSAGGFNERFLGAEDTELAYRLRASGGRFRFDIRSRVKHFHTTALGHYLRAQRRHSFWRMWLYLKHANRVRGDSYSGPVDHLQPPLALLLAASTPLSLHPAIRPVVALLAAALFLAQLPMTFRLVRRTRRAKYLWFIPFGMSRAFWRAWGALGGILSVLLKRN